MTLRLALLAAPLALLAACGPAEKTSAPSAAAPQAEQEAGKPADGPVAVKITPYVGGPLQVGAAGVGPITAATAFDQPTIAALFPKAQVKSAFIHVGEGPPGPIIVVEQDKVPLLEIGKGADGGISEIRLAAGDVRGPKGEGLLAKWEALGFTVDQCRAGEGRTINAVVCVRPEAPTVSYVFGVPGWTKGGVPDEKTLKAKAQLNEFIWRPAETAQVGAA
ncbi:DUF1131 domain-containing protein [Caulobacter sp. D4A]|uniref:DUF1131 family protein n=1 Tax=unclassified Caulobacter TaxID=2648921 RepID=UPI000D73633B|nr:MULTISPECIES: DUF1131 family protein [unclassified Caulobacter]PXA92230.1 DUF1131 domain-containing protein [Caulobacter sp. D4A]PXA96634.1 DUF1131 domain-containing protein [Caulobacter sp. D5]